MTIETKFNIGDKVFVLFFNKIYTVEIKHISVNVSVKGFKVPEIEIFYSADEIHDKFYDRKQKSFGENILFKTKQELLDSL